MSTLELDDDYLEPVRAECTDRELIVSLMDGRRIITPLWWYPFLESATKAQRDNIDLHVLGVWWPDLDEGLSINGMLSGAKAPNAKEPVKA